MDKRQRALTALMENDTLTAAAQAAGISRRTLYGYLHDDSDFATTYQQQRDEMAILTAERLEAEREQALNTIRSIMNDASQPATARIKAAGLILDAISTALRQVNDVVTANVQRTRKSLFDFDLL